jgi:3-isopropylmalate/(R)-2-methylmalate dehydratase large subunit
LIFEGRLYAPKGGEEWNKGGLLENIKIRSRCDFDTELNIDAADIEPMITYGTNPGMGIGISKSIPNASQVQGGAETLKNH